VISWEKMKKKRDGAFKQKKNGCVFCRGKIPLDDAPPKKIKI